jgi:hypothetical protein
MGKFELASAIGVRLEPIKETFVHSPAPPYVQIVELPPLRPQAAWTLRAVRDPSYGLRGQPVGRKGCPVNRPNGSSFPPAPGAIYDPDHGPLRNLEAVIFSQFAQCTGPRRHPCLLRQHRADALHARELVHIVLMLPHAADQTHAGPDDQ